MNYNSILKKSQVLQNAIKGKEDRDSLALIVLTMRSIYLEGYTDGSFFEQHGYEKFTEDLSDSC